MTVPHGAYIYRHQLPGYDLKCASSIEEQIFPSSDMKTLDRSRKKKLRVRCGKGYYRVVLLNLKVKAPFCYIFGTNILIASQQIPQWMRRETVVLPNPRRTTRHAIKNKYGFVLFIGRPKIGPVEIAGIRMRCTAINDLCTIRYENQKFYAHPSVVFPIKQTMLV